MKQINDTVTTALAVIRLSTAGILTITLTVVAVRAMIGNQPGYLLLVLVLAGFNIAVCQPQTIPAHLTGRRRRGSRAGRR